MFVMTRRNLDPRVERRKAPVVLHLLHQLVDRIIILILLQEKSVADVGNLGVRSIRRIAEEKQLNAISVDRLDIMKNAVGR